MSRQTSRSLRPAAGLVVFLALAVSCSVSTPRHGFSAAGDRGSSLPPETAGSGDRSGEIAPDVTSGSEETPTPDGRVGGGSSGSGGPAVSGGSGADDASSERSGSSRGEGQQGGPSGDNSAVGVTEDSITFSVVMGFGGTYGPVINEIYESGFKTWVDEVNSNGGIHGRKIVPKKVDHEETSEGGAAACKEVQNNGSLFAAILEGEGAGNITAAECLEEAGIMSIGYIPNPQPDWENVYTYLASSTAQGKSLPSFVRNVMGDGDKPLGVMHRAAPAYSVGKDAYVEAAQEEGLDVVRVEAIEQNQSSFTPQLLRMQNDGVGNIAIMAVLEAAGIMRDAAAMNYQPNFTGFVWVYDFVTQSAGPPAHGAQALRYSATVHSPRYDEFVAKADEHGNSSVVDGEAFLMYGAGLLIGHVLRNAGPDLNTQTLRQGLESTTNYYNEILPPITWGPGDTIGTEHSYPAECCDSQDRWQPIGPPKRRF